MTYLTVSLSLKGMDDVADEMLNYRTSRKKKCTNNIEDIFYGELYKRHFDCKGYFHGTSTAARGKEIHLSLMVNTVVSPFSAHPTLAYGQCTLS